MNKSTEAISKAGSKIKKGLVYNDFFGYPIAFNYNDKGSKHKTWMGGVVSIGIRITLFIYVTILFQRMYNLEENGNRIKTMQFYED